MKRFLLAGLIISSVLFPALSQAQVDQKCWIEKECHDQRRSLSAGTLNEAEVKNGFVIDETTRKACGGDTVGKDRIGFCLPAGQAETKISFGGETRFENIGVFIKSMYRYTIWVAGILATAMIIVAGFQWAASGGNSDAISSAKKRIAGATAGLIILLLSYTVLNTINPYLVNFRLPQIWLINSQGLVPNYCGELTEAFADRKLQDAGKAGEKSAANPNNGFTVNQSEAVCGRQYIVQGGGAQMCWGSVCSKPGEICNPFTYKLPDGGATVGPACESGDLVVKYNVKDLLTAVKTVLPLAGIYINQAEEDDWLNLDGGSSISTGVIAICGQPPKNENIKKGPFGKFCTQKAKTVSSKVVRLPGASMPEYIITYKGLTDISDSVCPSANSLIGLILSHPVDKNWSLVDGYMYTTWSRQGQTAYVDDYFSMYKAISQDPEQYGSISRLTDEQKSKRFLSATPTGDALVRILKENWTWEDYTCD